MKSDLLDILRKSAAKQAKPVTLSLSVGAGEEPVADIARRLVKKADSDVHVVHISPLARVIAVNGKPASLLPIVEAADVEDATFSAEPDIVPKPVKRGSVDIESDAGFYPQPSTAKKNRGGPPLPRSKTPRRR